MINICEEYTKDYTKEEITLELANNPKLTPRELEILEALAAWADCLTKNSSRQEAVDEFAKWLNANVPSAPAGVYPLSFSFSESLRHELFVWGQIAGNSLWDSEVLQEMVVARAAGDSDKTQAAWLKLNREWRVLAMLQPGDEQYFWNNVMRAANKLP
jgi:hypothetical protein